MSKYRRELGTEVYCTLMHKNVPVMDFLMYQENGEIIKATDILEYSHLPLGILKGGVVDKAEFNSWWRNRQIPINRDGLATKLERLGVSIPALVQKSMGLSLSDQYWVKPKGVDIDWGNINFFENDWEEDLGWYLLGCETSKPLDEISFMTPDPATNGCLPKGWHIVHGERCLFKTSERVGLRQQSFNEVVAHKLMERLGVDHAPYSIEMVEGIPMCITPDIINKDTELIPMVDIIKLQKHRNSVSAHQQVVACSKQLGCDDIETKLSQMIVVDYLLHNTDRHLNNFGLIRDANTLETIGFAPIFDFGTSLWYDFGNETFEALKGTECKPFRSKFDKQLELATDLSWFKPEALEGFGDEIRKIFSSCGDMAISPEQTERVVRGFESNLRKVVNYAHTLDSFNPDTPGLN